ncbi:MAG: hypothetical protein V2B20_24725 [Pseudomonadota bacterium]
MESNRSAKRKGIIAAIFFGFLCCGLLVFWALRGLQHATVSQVAQLVHKDIPILSLDLAFTDLEGEVIPVTETRLLSHVGPAAEKIVSEAPCPEIIGGDAPNGQTALEKRQLGDNCPKQAKWYVKRHPPALSLHFIKPEKFLPLFATEGPVKSFWESRFVQGLLRDPLQSGRVRAEDLGLAGLEGAFLEKLTKEALAADAILHYDFIHGNKGFVFSFVRNKCPYAAKALPIIAAKLVRSGYQVPGIDEPVFEMHVGLQRFFLCQYKERVYLANGLEALLNIVDQETPLEDDAPKTPMVLSLRGEAFLDNLIPTIVGKPRFHMHLGIDFSDNAPGFLRLDSGKYANHLRTKLFKGVPASIPQDIFAAVVTSFHLSAEMTDDTWLELAENGPGETAAAGPEESGVAILWDLASEEQGVTGMGVAIANQDAPEKVKKMDRYFKNEELTEVCGGGTVYLAATNKNLLLRMLESCEHRSMSILDWERGRKSDLYATSQLSMFMNPGSGLRELLLAGGAAASENTDLQPEWKQEMEKAKARLYQEGKAVFGRLPILGYAGNAASGAKTIELKGFTVQQGVSP